MYKPNETGSQGGSSTSGDPGGRGGGKAYITVGAVMITDGKIEADGGDASNGAGGGSGGSICIITGIEISAYIIFAVIAMIFCLICIILYLASIYMMVEINVIEVIWKW